MAVRHWSGHACPGHCRHARCHQPQRLAAYCVIVSSGTLLAALGLGGAAIKGAALFYLVSSVLATGALFMLSEMIERTQQSGEAYRAAGFERFGPKTRLDPDRSDEVVGIVIPAAMAFLGMSFLGCALLVTGLAAIIRALSVSS